LAELVEAAPAAQLAERAVQERAAQPAERVVQERAAQERAEQAAQPAERAELEARAPVALARWTVAKTLATRDPATRDPATVAPEAQVLAVRVRMRVLPEPLVRELPRASEAADCPAAARVAQRVRPALARPKVMAV
jgi:hypothetical protein